MDITHLMPHLNGDVSTASDSEDPSESPHESDAPLLHHSLSLSMRVSSFVTHLHSLDLSLSQSRAEFLASIKLDAKSFAALVIEGEARATELLKDIEHYHTEIAMLNHDRAEVETELSHTSNALSASESERDTLVKSIAGAEHSLAQITAKQQRRSQAAKKKKPPVFEFANIDHANTVSLPGSIIDVIFGCLSVRDLCRACHVGKRWQQSIDRNRVWSIAMKRIISSQKKRKRLRTISVDEDTRNGSSGAGSDDPDIDEVVPPITFDDNAVTSSPSLDNSDVQWTASINLPYPDAPCIHHFHYQLLIQNDLPGQYTVTVQSKLIRTLYHCAAFSETFDGAKKPNAKDKKTLLTVSCTLNPKPNNIDATDVEFCRSMCELHQQSLIAQNDIARLTEQTERDEAIKLGYANEIDDCESEFSAINNELTMREAQHMADEMTSTFLREQKQTLTEQLSEERKQTHSLALILAAQRQRQEVELEAKETEQDRLEQEYQQLKHARKQWHHARDTLRVELETAEWETEATLAKLDEIKDLIARLKKAV